MRYAIPIVACFVACSVVHCDLNPQPYPPQSNDFSGRGDSGSTNVGPVGAGASSGGSSGATVIGGDSATADATVDAAARGLDAADSAPPLGDAGWRGADAAGERDVSNDGPEETDAPGESDAPMDSAWDAVIDAVDADGE
jgi:hypothetical protein